jgi:hypothetical protein
MEDKYYWDTETHVSFASGKEIDLSEHPRLREVTKEDYDAFRENIILKNAEITKRLKEKYSKARRLDEGLLNKRIGPCPRT